MKRFISILISLILCTTALFSQTYDDEDEYDDGYVYEQNGAGDRFIKFDFGADFPLNFNKQLYVGAAASVGFYYFISNNIAVGGDVILGYNLSIGQKPLISIPFTFGTMFQPYIGKLEFPIVLNFGLASISREQEIYFPALAVKSTAGAFYRFSETWSAGISANGFWIPQFFLLDKDTRGHKFDQGLFATVGLSVRYHF